jgi:hypothetical protein
VDRERELPGFADELMVGVAERLDAAVVAAKGSPLCKESENAALMLALVVELRRLVDAVDDLARVVKARK